MLVSAAVERTLYAKMHVGDTAAPYDAAAGERQLACAVLAFAVKDAAAHTRYTIDARAFCTAQQGRWARAREQWCTWAGIDPDVFRAAMLRKLAPCS